MTALKKNLSLFLPALGSQNVSDTLFQYEVTICLITFFIFIFVPIKCLHRLKLVCLFIFMVSKHLNRVLQTALAGRFAAA